MRGRALAREMWSLPLLLVLVLAVSAPAAAKKKEEAVIEEVGAKQLEQLVEQHDYVAVFWCEYPGGWEGGVGEELGDL